MLRAHVDRGSLLRVNPSTQNAPTREHQRVRALRVEDGQLKIPVERGGGDRVPHAYADGLWSGGWH